MSAKLQRWRQGAHCAKDGGLSLDDSGPLAPIYRGDRTTLLWRVGSRAHLVIAAWTGAMHCCSPVLLKRPPAEAAIAALRALTLPVPLTWHAKRYAEGSGHWCGGYLGVRGPLIPPQTEDEDV